MTNTFELSVEQKEKFADIKKWYPEKVEKVYNKVVIGKLRQENFWDVARDMTKSVKSCKHIREWQIVFEYVYNRIFLNREENF